MSTNKFIVFTGSSGVGKATIEKQLFADKDLHLRLSCSATTREAREGEVDGVHYHFLTTEEFDEKIKNNEFIEWNSHFSNKYGTLKSEIKNIQNNNEVPLIEVETVGAKNIMDNFDESEYISIFIAPPSLEVLKERIKGRGTESDEQVEERMARVTEEYGYKDLFQHVVINDDVERAANEIKEILKKEL